MNITEAALKNHEELFPNHKSALKITDPEFIELFDNFAFDEVLQYADIDVKLRMKVTLATLIASQALSEYRVMLVAALNVGVTPVEVKEIVYQAVPYAGLAKVFDFLHATNEVLEERGVELPLPGQSTTTPETRYEKGVEKVREIVGDAVDEMLKTSPDNQKHIAKYLAGNCFGDYYTRTGLDNKTRELLTFSMILSLGGCESQLKGHIEANTRVGNDKVLLLKIVTCLLPFIGYPRTLNAIRCINEVLPENR